MKLDTQIGINVSKFIESNEFSFFVNCLISDLLNSKKISGIIHVSVQIN
jgi:hypothetical protein